MGQRHQAFIIARIVPHGSTDGKAYYRSLGGWHHQWCYGSLPLQAADRFFDLIKNPVNAAIIREELKTAQGKYGRFGQEPDPDFPCHYSLFLLACAFNIDLEKNYLKDGPLEGSLLPAARGCWSIANNDGLTILDITDPLNPSYAFVMGSETATDLGDEPCIAEDYLRAYYPDLGCGDREEDQKPNDKAKLDLAAKFDSISFLTEDMLAEVWPEEFGASKRLENRRPATRTSVAKAVPNAPSVLADASVVPDLVDLIIEPAVARCLDSGNTDDIELLIPGKTSQILNVLRVRKPFPDEGLPLLIAALQQELKDNPETLNLSGFSLSPAQLASVASKLPDARVITLSHSPTVTVEHVHSLLAAKPEIDCLDLLDTGIGNEEIFSLLISEPDIFKCVSDVVHHYLVSSRHVNPGSFHVFASQSGSFIRYDGRSHSGTIQAIPIWTPAKILQNLVDMMATLVTDNPPSTDPIQSILIPATLSTGLRKPDTPWRNRTIPMVARDMAKINSGGWVFLYDRANTPRGSAPRGRYAFGRLLADESRRSLVDTYDVHGFLEEMKKEGRAPLPSAELVKDFEEIMANRGKGKTGNEKNSKEFNREDMPLAMEHIMRLFMTGLNTSEESAQTESGLSLLDSDAATSFVMEFFAAAFEDEKRPPSGVHGPMLVLPEGR